MPSGRTPASTSSSQPPASRARAAMAVAVRSLSQRYEKLGAVLKFTTSSATAALIVKP